MAPCYRQYQFCSLCAEIDMTVAGGSRARLAYVAEVTYGTTPATPSFKTLNPTSHSLGL